MSDGSFVEWLVSVPGMALLALRPDDGNTMINSIMRGYGIAMDRNFPFVLLVNASSLNNGTVLQCTSIVSEVATLSSSVAICVFGKFFFLILYNYANMYYLRGKPITILKHVY